MEFSAEQYFQAGQERIEQAWDLHKHGKAYALAICCGGVAVESMLRAFRYSFEKGFDGRHDLRRLRKESRFLELERERLQQQRLSHEGDEAEMLELTSHFNTVETSWHNNLRYASEDYLHKVLKDFARDRRLKGDYCKELSRGFLGAAQAILERGGILWKFRQKSSGR